MKVKYKKICAVGILALTLATSTTVTATSILDKNESTDSILGYAEDTSYSLLRGNNLNLGTTGITKLASNKISMSGLTQCHHECDIVYLTLALEQKSNGSYSTYKIWDFTDYNVTHLSRAMEVIVPSGHYYRVRGYHAAKDGSKESTTTLTQGVLVN